MAVCGCPDNKKLYGSYRLAVKVVLRSARRSGKALRIYQCPRVPVGYHLTSKPKRETV